MPKLSKFRIKGVGVGVLGLINPHFFSIVYLVIFPNLGSYYHCARVWGTHLEVICHLLYVHA